ncbi:MAG: nuclear transport factor 2 family protein [Saprospiraceae bacterium]|nr:nuclear transport factor 2 family protein [Saprospiraceae bacterium]
MNQVIYLLVSGISILFLTACSETKTPTPLTSSAHTPVDQALFDEIMAMDKTFFDAYNHCDLETQATILANNIEFLHDNTGLTTSKEDILASTEKYICGKVTRHLIEGSVEVYPIKNYGAVQMGYHKFHNNQEPDAPSDSSRFITVWNNTETGNWQIAKVISLH